MHDMPSFYSPTADPAAWPRDRIKGVDAFSLLVFISVSILFLFFRFPDSVGRDFNTQSNWPSLPNFMLLSH